MHARAQPKDRRGGRGLISPEILRTTVEPEPPLLTAGGGARLAIAVATPEPEVIADCVPDNRTGGSGWSTCSHDSLMKASCCAAALLTSRLAAARWFYPPLSLFFISVGAFFNEFSC